MGESISSVLALPPARAAERDNRRRTAGGLLAELEESVRLRLMCDVPLGAMLSGGIDSSLIVALMARHTSGPVKRSLSAFSRTDQNELAHAREVAQLFGTDHHELELSRADAEIDLPGLTWFLDEPLADLSSLGFSRCPGLRRRTSPSPCRVRGPTSCSADIRASCCVGCGHGRALPGLPLASRHCCRTTWASTIRRGPARVGAEHRGSAHRIEQPDG